MTTMFLSTTLRCVPKSFRKRASLTLFSLPLLLLLDQIMQCPGRLNLEGDQVN